MGKELGWLVRCRIVCGKSKTTGWLGQLYMCSTLELLGRASSVLLLFPCFPQLLIHHALLTEYAQKWPLETGLLDARGSGWAGTGVTMLLNT